jgi:hypothetical protein
VGLEIAFYALLRQSLRFFLAMKKYDLDSRLRGNDGENGLFCHFIPRNDGKERSFVSFSRPNGKFTK